MRLCIVGNSHVGMLRGACDLDRARGRQITWFAKAGRGLEQAEVKGHTLSVSDPEIIKAMSHYAMPSLVDMRDYDGLVLVASTASLFHVVQLLRAHRVSSWPSGAVLSGEILNGQRPEMAVLSASAFEHSLRGIIEDNLTFRFVRDLRKVSKIPIRIVPQPLPGAQVLEQGSKKVAGFRRIARDKDGANAAQALRRAHHAAFAPFDDVTVLDQPEDTIADGAFTDRIYTRGAVRLNTDFGLPKEDILHANPDMGLRVMDQIKTSLTF